MACPVPRWRALLGILGGDGLAIAGSRKLSLDLGALVGRDDRLITIRRQIVHRQIGTGLPGMRWRVGGRHVRELARTAAQRERRHQQRTASKPRLLQVPQRKHLGIPLLVHARLSGAYPDNLPKLKPLLPTNGTSEKSSKGPHEKRCTAIVTKARSFVAVQHIFAHV